MATDPRGARPITVLALDVGGSQLRTAAILPDGRCVARHADRTPIEAPRGTIERRCAELLDASRGAVPDGAPPVAGVGISSAGPVHPWTGTIVDPPNIPPLHDTPIASILAGALELPVFLERDTNVAALGEQWMGAARACANFLYVTVSTGLGGAIVRDGSLVLGPDGTAGELGHGALMLDEAVPCGCGGDSHLEAIASGSGLARQAASAVVAGRSPFLAERARLARLTGRDVAEGEAAGDETSAFLMDRARLAFAVACVGWVNTFNPERIVVGGTLAKRQGDRWLDPARERVAREAFRGPAARVRIVPAELGDDVGLVGAWPLVRQRLGRPEWRGAA